jgi:hypothetical protein
MCKTNMKTNIYYVNICKHEYEKNMTRLWCKIMLKTNVEQIWGVPIYTPLGTLLKETFEEVSMCAPSKEAFWKPF